MRTCLPACLRTLIASDMDKFRRKKFENFIEYILKELECRFLCTINLLEYAPFGSSLVMILKTALKFRIASDCSKSVTRKLDFRNNGHITLCSILHKFLNLFLGVISAMRNTIIDT